jgi:hypothetical protein
LATPATRISVARTAPARFGLLDAIAPGIYPRLTTLTPPVSSP